MLSPKELYGRFIICSPKNSKFIESRYPTRPIRSCAYCSDDWFYYYGYDGTLRHVFMQDMTLWVSGNNHRLLERLR